MTLSRHSDSGIFETILSTTCTHTHTQQTTLHYTHYAQYTMLHILITLHHTYYSAPHTLTTLTTLTTLHTLRYTTPHYATHTTILHKHTHMISWVQYSGDILSNVTINNSLDVVTMVNCKCVIITSICILLLTVGQIKIMRGLSWPQPQCIHCVVTKTWNGLVIWHCHDNLCIFPPIHLSMTIKVYRNDILWSRQFPGTTIT